MNFDINKIMNITFLLFYSYKFCHSRWCNDGSQGPSECNVRELRSSGRSQFYSST